MITYEERLSRNLREGFNEAGLHFENESAVHKTLRKIIKRLDELGIPCAVVGAMAMFFHGYRRFTMDVDLLVTAAGLKAIQERLEGFGYVSTSAGSKQLRDAESGVRIEFLVAGGYPGDGRPKPVVFPHPEETGVEIAGVRCLRLPNLVEIKLAAGVTNPGRLSDLGDVQKMIAALRLPKDLAAQLDPFVRAKYLELWEAVQNNPAEP
jgi:hypothetical protein